MLVTKALNYLLRLLLMRSPLCMPSIVTVPPGQATTPPLTAPQRYPAHRSLLLTNYLQGPACVLQGCSHADCAHGCTPCGRAGHSQAGLFLAAFFVAKCHHNPSSNRSPIIGALRRVFCGSSNSIPARRPSGHTDARRHACAWSRGRHVCARPHRIPRACSMQHPRFTSCTLTIPSPQGHQQCL